MLRTIFGCLYLIGVSCEASGTGSTAVSTLGLAQTIHRHVSLDGSTCDSGLLPQEFTKDGKWRIARATVRNLSMKPLIHDTTPSVGYVSRKFG